MPRGAEALGFVRHSKATVVGPIAARALRQARHARVSACFEHSLYLHLDAGLLCVGGVSLGAGPLNLLCEPSPKGLLRARLNPGDAARISADTLFAGPLRIDFGVAEPWWPTPVGPWDAASLGRGLACARTALRQLRPDDGLSLLLARESPLPGRAMARAAAAPVDYLAQLLRARAAEVVPDAARIKPLIGLGPGLTPSGDDLLGGLLVALALVGRLSLRDRLWQALQGVIAEHTTDISRAHLAAAAEGFGGAALHAVLNAIVSGASAPMEAACAALGRVGHTSGWDALAGGLLVLETTAEITI